MELTGLGTSESQKQQQQGDGGDFLSEYKSISNKLKKRFLRRPNVSEAIESFSRLSKKLNAEDQPQYEGLCHLAVARCESSVGNHLAEAEALIAASRSFLEAEIQIENVKCPTFEEHLLAAIHSYNHAIKILDETDQRSRAAGLCLEIGDYLSQTEKFSEAISFYQRASEFLSNTVIEYCQAKEKVGLCYVQNGDYHNALAILTEVSMNIESQIEEPFGAVECDILCRCEVLRILLLLILEPLNQNIPPNLTSILDKYATFGTSNNSNNEDEEEDGLNSCSYLSEELFLSLQSLVISAQVKDKESVADLEDHLAPMMGKLPNDLLRKLVKNMQDKLPDFP